MNYKNKNNPATKRRFSLYRHFKVTEKPGQHWHFFHPCDFTHLTSTQTKKKLVFQANKAHKTRRNKKKKQTGSQKNPFYPSWLSQLNLWGKKDLTFQYWTALNTEIQWVTTRADEQLLSPNVESLHRNVRKWLDTGIIR